MTNKELQEALKALPDDYVITMKVYGCNGEIGDITISLFQKTVVLADREYGDGE